MFCLSHLCGCQSDALCVSCFLCVPLHVFSAIIMGCAASFLCEEVSTINSIKPINKVASVVSTPLYLLLVMETQFLIVGKNCG